MARLQGYALALFVWIGFTGCNDSGFEAAKVFQQVIPGPTGPVVCDPFGGSGVGGSTNGIDAKLTYLPQNASAISSGLSVASFEPGAPDVMVSPVRLILSQLAVSTRPFTEGFSSEDSGEKLKDESGSVLDEFFSVRGLSNIRLAAGNTPGDYELALLSDDGSILDLDENANGNFERWVSNDGNHNNLFACSTKVLHMTNTSQIPIRMNYYQGPRVRIALMMLWRLKSTSAEPECGVNRADTYYFEPVGSNPSSPTAKYNALLARGWKPLAPANFVLPNGATNPCVP